MATQINYTVDSTVECTKEYSVFKIDKWNRDINQAHVFGLVDAIKRENMSEHYPILVLPDMTVFDGQHRLEALKYLELPVYFKVVNPESPETMIDINLNVRRWTPPDYVKYYAARGVQSAIVVSELCKQYKVSVSFMIDFFQGHRRGGSNQIPALLQRLVIDENKIREAGRFFDDIHHFSRYKFTKTTRFMEAFHHVWKNTRYEHNVMKKQFNNYTSILMPQTTREGYIQNLVQLYNYNRSRENHLVLGKEDE